LTRYCGDTLLPSEQEEEQDRLDKQEQVPLTDSTPKERPAPNSMKNSLFREEQQRLIDQEEFSALSEAGEKKAHQESLQKK